MRGKRAKKRKILPDAIYNSESVSKFINYFMLDGKKDTSTKLVYKALEILGEKSKMKPIEAFDKAIDEVKPKIEVRSRRVGGSNYQVPVPVGAERQTALACKWIIKATRESRKTTDSAVTLANVLMDAINKQGAAYKKKEETHKMAEANKAFAHFQW